MRIFLVITCLCCLLLGACTEPSPTGTLDPTPSSEQTATQKDRIEIPIGTPLSHVLKTLGTADTIEAADNGREIWRYSGKKAEYAYFSKNTGTQTLIIGNYLNDPHPGAPGQTLLLTIVFDAAKKVADFNVALMTF